MWPNPQNFQPPLTNLDELTITSLGAYIPTRDLTIDDPQWRPVDAKPNIWIHDDDPTHEVEVIAYSCPMCFERKTVYISTTLATDQDRLLHSVCAGCGVVLTQITTFDSETNEPDWLKRPRAHS